MRKNREFNRPLRVGVTAAWMHEDPTRTVYNGRALLYVEQSMVEWLMRCEGIWPVMIPATRPGRVVKISAEDYLHNLDGLVVQGGVDVAPESYGETPLRPEWSGDPLRDRNEIDLIHAAMKLDRPILGICRGHQVLNVALGGSLFQDLGTQIERALSHRDSLRYHRNSHTVELLKGGKLASLYGRRMGIINSVHHQGIKDLAPALQVEAISPEDGVIEAVSYKEDDRFAWGLQWHPEFQEAQQEELLPPDVLLDPFIDAMQTRAKNRSD